jgi:hypothetical protein
MSILPDFEMDVTGEYSGNAYPEQRVYRIKIQQVGDGTEFLLTVDDDIEGYRFDEYVADGITEMASRDHGLSGYEDDWSLPDGMNRALRWDIGDSENYIVLTEGQIDEVATWLRFALGLDTYDGPADRWES